MISVCYDFQCPYILSSGVRPGRGRQEFPKQVDQGIWGRTLSVTTLASPPSFHKKNLKKMLTVGKILS
jgi:hypothetical protein